MNHLTGKLSHSLAPLFSRFDSSGFIFFGFVKDIIMKKCKMVMSCVRELSELQCV